jgi:hypothetical protein
MITLPTIVVLPYLSPNGCFGAVVLMVPMPELLPCSYQCILSSTSLFSYCMYGTGTKPLKSHGIRETKTRDRLCDIARSNNGSFCIHSTTTKSKMGRLSRGQDLALPTLTIFSVVLSLLGSSTINRRFFGENKIGTYERILVFMSTFDLFCSSSFVLQQFVTPKGTSHFSIGNDKTCRAMDVMFQISYAGFLYYTMLSFYYWLTISMEFPKTGLPAMLIRSCTSS